jgi:hypothetical protein
MIYLFISLFCKNEHDTNFIESMLLLLAVAFEMAIGFFLGAGICIGIEYILPSHYVSDIVTIVVLLGAMFLPFYLDFKLGPMLEDFFEGLSSRKNKRAADKKKAQEEALLRKKKKKNEFPGIIAYFEKELEKNKNIRELKKMTFLPYVFANGEKARYIKLSEDEKWVKIHGKYYPLDLISRYDPKENSIYAIDSTAVELPFYVKYLSISKELTAFFKERGSQDSVSPYISKAYFEGELKRSKGKLKNMDWAELRYKWEESMAGFDHRYNRSNANQLMFRPLTEEGEVNRQFMETVLSEEEIQSVVKAIRKGKIDISEYTDFVAYKNEFVVCNGVMLMKFLKYPDNRRGIDFLFECLNDVDEAYFKPAVEILSKLPRKELEGRIEERVAKAHQSGDAMRLAGLLYLAREMKYKIKYVQDLKAGLITVEHDNKDMLLEDENGNIRFAPEEVSEYGEKEAVAFQVMK